MASIDKYQSLLLLGAIALGSALGRAPPIAAVASSVITPALVTMLVDVFLHIPLSDFKQGLRNMRFTGTNLAVKFLWTPLFAGDWVPCFSVTNPICGWV